MKNWHNEFTIERAKSCDRLDSSDGKTTKFLLEFGDGIGVVNSFNAFNLMAIVSVFLSQAGL